MFVYYCFSGTDPQMIGSMGDGVLSAPQGVASQPPIIPNTAQSANTDYGQLSSSFIQGPSFKPGQLGTSPIDQGQVLTSTPYRGYQPAQLQQQPLQPQQQAQQQLTNGKYFWLAQLLPTCFSLYAVV